MQGSDKKIQKNINPKTVLPERRYDVDWLRTLALGLLIVYHVSISFQPWAKSIGFPHNKENLRWFWIFMSMINVWRIPILFLISGMGLRFSMERRNWKQLLKERTIRILIPYIFGIFVLQYIVSLASKAIGWDARFNITFGHLWFLLNIFLYIIWLIGIIIYLKDAPDNIFFKFMSKLIKWPFGLFLLALPLMLEAWLTAPKYFSTYVDTLHGWLLGLICFFLGFIFISLKDVFWAKVEKIRSTALIIAFLLYLTRLFIFKLVGMPNWLTAFESMCWMLAILGFGSKYLNKPSHILEYLNKAVYPVYFIHMPVQFIISYFLLPLSLPAALKLLLLLSGTFGVSFLLYEYVLRRIKYIRPLFGMKLNRK